MEQIYNGAEAKEKLQAEKPLNWAGKSEMVLSVQHFLLMGDCDSATNIDVVQKWINENELRT